MANRTNDQDYNICVTYKSRFVLTACAVFISPPLSLHARHKSHVCLRRHRPRTPHSLVPFPPSPQTSLLTKSLKWERARSANNKPYHPFIRPVRPTDPPASAAGRTPTSTPRKSEQRFVDCWADRGRCVVGVLVAARAAVGVLSVVVLAAIVVGLLVALFVLLSSTARAVVAVCIVTYIWGMSAMCALCCCVVVAVVFSFGADGDAARAVLLQLAQSMLLLFDPTLDGSPAETTPEQHNNKVITLYKKPKVVTATLPGETQQARDSRLSCLKSRCCFFF